MYTMKHVTYSDGRIELNGDPDELRKFFKKVQQKNTVTSVKERCTRRTSQCGKRSWNPTEEEILIKAITGKRRVSSKQIVNTLISQGYQRRTAHAIDTRIGVLRKRTK